MCGNHLDGFSTVLWNACLQSDKCKILSIQRLFCHSDGKSRMIILALIYISITISVI
jgi:hypothetical protein